MTQRTTNSRRGRGPDSPLITEELKRLRDGDAAIRIATQWNTSVRSVERVRSRLYDEPLSIFEYHVVIHRGKGDYQWVFCGESKSRQSQCQRHVLAHFFAHHIAQNIDLRDIPEVF